MKDSSARGKVDAGIYKYSLITLTMALIFAFGFFIRAYKLPTLLNTECWDITNSIRLHYLSFFNFGDTIRFNFLKSLFMGTHGIIDSLYWYFVAGLYNALHIPISEHYIYLAQVILGMSLIAFMSFVSYRMLGKRLGIILFTMIFGVLNLDHIMVMSRTHWFYNSSILMELLTYAAIFFRFNSGKKIFWNILLCILMFINAASPNIIIVPMVLLLQYLLYLEKSETSLLGSIPGFLKSLLNFGEMLIWSGYMFGIVIIYFTQRTIGTSGLGLFGNITHIYGFNALANIPKALNEAKIQLLTRAPDPFYNIMFVLSVITGSFYIAARRLPYIGRRYLFFGILFLYHFGIGAFFGRFYLYDIFIPIIILGGVGLYYTFDSINNIASNNGLIRKTIYYPLIIAVSICTLIVSVDRVNMANRRKNGKNLIPFVPSFNDTTFDAFYLRVNPLKTIGYYLRENADKTDKIYLLFGGDAWTGNAEYYFGKKAMITEAGTNKQIFDNTYSLEFYKERDGVEIFDYYIAIESFSFGDYYRDMLSEAVKMGVKKIIDVKYKGEIYASIYSAKNVPYEVLNMEDYDKKWDRKYANLKNIYENKLVGLVSLWGLR